MEQLPPPLFRPLSFEDALAAATLERKLLLLDFTAGWCAPCQHMDRTAWSAPEVEGWVQRHAVAVQVDVDLEEGLTKRFGIRAMPTLVLLRPDGTELDRATGARPAAELLKWLDDARRGRTELDTLRQVEETDLHGRLHLARVLLGSAKADEALRHLLYLWDRAVEVDPGWYGVRHSFLAGVMGDAAEASQPVRQRLEQLRDEAGKKLDQLELFRDWCTLNRVLHEEHVTLAWFDQVKHQPPAGLHLDDDHTLLALLRARDRWRDYGQLVSAPLIQLRRTHQIVRDSRRQMKQGADDDSGFRDHLLESTEQLFRDDAADLCRALKAAGRDDDERAVRDEALTLDPSPAMKAALDAVR